MTAKMIIKNEEINHRLLQGARLLTDQNQWAELRPADVSEPVRRAIVTAAQLDDDSVRGVFEFVAVNDDNWKAVCNLLNHYAGVPLEAAPRSDYRNQYKQRPHGRRLQ